MLKNRRVPIGLIVIIPVLSVVIWWFMRSPQPIAIKIEENSTLTWQEQVNVIETKLRADPNDEQLWFELGHYYLQDNEFANALTCFDYSIRLTISPRAEQFAAKASALYYLHSQQMNEDVKLLLDQALAIDELNQTALMLLASDHFISFRYEQAIKLWTQLLDANRIETNRALLITRINQAKEMLPK